MAQSLYRSLLPTLQRSGLYNTTSSSLLARLSSPISSALSLRPAFQLTNSRPFSSTNMSSSSSTFIDAVKSRRTFYQINKKAPISDDKIIGLVNDTVLHVPSCFNSQSTRVVVLLNEDHDKFWDYVFEVLQPMLPDEQQKATTKARIDGFRAGYGSVSPSFPTLFARQLMSCHRPSSSKTRYRFKRCRRNFHLMRTGSLNGPSTHLRCINSFYGPLWSLRVLDAVCSITTRSSTRRCRVNGTFPSFGS
jgi:hypothetical protein